MKAFRLILFSSLFLLTACAVELKDSDTEGKAASPSSPSIFIHTLTETSLNVQLVGLPEPQAYQVVFQWPAAPGRLVIQKNSQQPVEVFAHQRSFIDREVTGGETVTYTLQHFNDHNELLASIPISVQIPRDLILDGDIQLRSHREIKAHRIFLLPRTVITTEVFNLKMEAEEIHFTDSTIQNFKSEVFRASESHGRSGGQIQIRSTSGSGRLMIFLRGENGGNGKPGGISYNKKFKCFGTDGGHGGNAGSLKLQISDKSSLKTLITNEGGRAGQAGGYGAVPYNAPPTESIQYPCSTKREGRSGRDGARGTVDNL
ncbi:hypothetical protein D3C87_339810 [compost metagenome]